MLGIFDDIFPVELSAWRVAEFNAYLRELPSHVQSTFEFGPWGNTTEILARWRGKNPDIADKIRYFHDGVDQLTAGYSLFLLGTYFFTEKIYDPLGLPFVFCLYPGGGLHLEEPRTGHLLARITQSPNFRQVISTQRPTTQFLLDHGVKQVTEIVGGCYAPDLMDQTPVRTDRKRIFFAANGDAWHKGFDVFVQAARELGDQADFICAGRFSAQDAPGVPITFLGTLQHEEFKYHACRADAVLHVSRVAHNGNFDGFPNGSSVTAGFCGAAMITSDPINQNCYFTDGEDILLVTPETAVQVLKENWNRLDQIGRAGQETIRRYYCHDAQIKPRIDLLRSIM